MYRYDIGHPCGLRWLTAIVLGGASRRGPLPVELPVRRVRSEPPHGASLLVKRVLRTSVLLKICRS